MAVNTTTHDLASIDEALRWATSDHVRVWAYIDRLLDARLEVAGGAQ